VDEDLIRQIASDFTDPEERAKAERDVRRKVQARANEDAADRRVRREAMERANDLGIGDPLEYAAKAVAYDRQERRSARQQASDSRRAKVVLRRMANRGAASRESAAKTARPNTRRSSSRDRQYVAALGKAERDGHAISSPLVTSELKKLLKAYAPPHWDKGTTPIKVMALSLESSERGAWTINLRLTPEVCAKALASPRGPASFLQDRVRKAMEREFGASPEFWFVVERDNDQRFHLHGAVVCEIGDEAVVARIEKALEAAGGRWDSRAGRLYQQKGRVLIDPFWWAAYVIKDLNLTAIGIERKLFASTAEIKDAARGNWDFVRSKLPRA